MTWLKGTPLLSPLTGFYGVVGKEIPQRLTCIDVFGAEHVADFRDMVLNESRCDELALSIGAVRMSPEASHALLSLLQSCNPTSGPLLEAWEALQKPRDNFLPMVRDALNAIYHPNDDFQYADDEDNIFRLIVDGMRPEGIRLQWDGDNVVILRESETGARYFIEMHKFTRPSRSFTDAVDIAKKVRKHLMVLANHWKPSEFLNAL